MSENRGKDMRGSVKMEGVRRDEGNERDSGKYNSGKRRAEEGKIDIRTELVEV